MTNFYRKLTAIALPLLLAGSLAAAETNIADAATAPEPPPPPTPEVTKQSIPSSSGQIVGTSKTAMNRRSPGPEMLIPIVAIVSVFGSLVVSLTVLVRYKANKEKRLHETIRLMIEKGVPIPPELVRGGGNEPFAKDHPNPKGDFRKGIQDLAFGAGVIIVISLLPISRFWPVGLIFIFVGVARLICWKVEKKTTEQDK